MEQQGQHYRARKAIEWKYTRGWTNRRIAEELDVTEQTVSGYINHPPEELQEPIRHFKKELTAATFSRLQEQLAEAGRRAREAERPERVFEYDENGDLVAEEIHFENGGSKWVPKVKGMEMQPDAEQRAYARREEREIIQMLWNLAGVEEPEEVEVSGGLDVSTEFATLDDGNGE